MFGEKARTCVNPCEIRVSEKSRDTVRLPDRGCSAETKPAWQRVFSGAAGVCEMMVKMGPILFAAVGIGCAAQGSLAQSETYSPGGGKGREKPVKVARPAPLP